jgi:hypothetical protein
MKLDRELPEAEPEEETPSPSKIDSSWAEPARDEEPTEEPASDTDAAAPADDPAWGESTLGSAPTVDEEPETNAAVTPEANTQLAMLAWTDALRSVERSINEATEAIRFLRATFQQMSPLIKSLGGLEDALRVFEDPSSRPQRVEEITPQPLAEEPAHYEREEAAPQSAYERRAEDGGRGLGWQTGRQAWQRKPPARAPVPEEEPLPVYEPARATLKPVTLVPDDTPALYAYRVTVEDPKSPVELIQLHQAFAGIPAVRNLSLLNYVNGVASIALETMEEIEPPELESAIRKTLKRSCSVLPHESNVILIQVRD